MLRLVLVILALLVFAQPASARTFRLDAGEQRQITTGGHVLDARGSARLRVGVRSVRLTRRWRRVSLPARKRVRIEARGRGHATIRLTVSPALTPSSPPAPTPSSPPAPTPPLPPVATPPASNPLAGASLWVDPDSQAARWLAARPDERALLERIALQPQAVWLAEWTDDVRAAAASVTTRAAAQGALPILVAYAIPQRDCSGYSGGGEASAAAYRAWIRELAAGIGDRPAVVIVEPDALAQLECLPAADRETRLALVRDAVEVLTARPRVTAYLDAGHSAWQSSAVMAERLRAAGVGRARGFALNVSNYRATTELAAYAHALSERLGGAHAVLDTSRNGRGPGSGWCNPPGRGLGAPPTPLADPVIDALLWIKRPGESDGPCNGGPSAGTFWLDGALELARNAL